MGEFFTHRKLRMKCQMKKMKCQMKTFGQLVELMVKEPSPKYFQEFQNRDGHTDKVSFQTPSMVAEHAFANLPDIDKVECFAAYYFDTQMKCIDMKILTVGTLDRSLIHPRDVFREGCVLNAHSVVLVHNHPSSNVAPSRIDEDLTRRMIEAGRILSIEVVDHIVVGGRLDKSQDVSFYSFRQMMTELF